LLGGPGRTSPGGVGFNNPDCPVGLISIIRLDLTFDGTRPHSRRGSIIKDFKEVRLSGETTSGLQGGDSGLKKSRGSTPGEVAG